MDGSYFNNSFGWPASPATARASRRSRSEALEEIQVNVAPYDVRQGNFVGAGVNTVTRSGGNAFRGSAYYWFRDESLVGRRRRACPFDPGLFEFDKWGG